MTGTDTYTVMMRCGNCLTHHAVRIPKGERAGRDRVCPNCGCAALNVVGPAPPSAVPKHPEPYGVPEPCDDAWGRPRPWYGPKRGTFWCKAEPQPSTIIQGPA